MYEPENENEISEQTNENGGGEYRYDGGFEKESIYADAHYTPADENTVPPRYYTPPEPKKTVKKEKSGKGGRLVGIICLCLVCALLGGLVGGGFFLLDLDLLGVNGNLKVDVAHSGAARRERGRKVVLSPKVHVCGIAVGVRLKAERRDSHDAI